MNLTIQMKCTNFLKCTIYLSLLKNSLNSLLSIKKIEFLIKILDTKNPTVLDGLTGDFYHSLNDK